jgi:hypothetical protein
MVGPLASRSRGRWRRKNQATAPARANPATSHGSIGTLLKPELVAGGAAGAGSAIAGAGGGISNTGALAGGRSDASTWVAELGVPSALEPIAALGASDAGVFLGGGATAVVFLEGCRV